MRFVANSLLIISYCFINFQEVCPKEIIIQKKIEKNYASPVRLPKRMEKYDTTFTPALKISFLNDFKLVDKVRFQFLETLN